MTPPPWALEPRPVFGVVCLLVGFGLLLGAGLAGLEWYQHGTRELGEVVMGGAGIVFGVPLGVLSVVTGIIVLTPRRKA